MATFDLTGISNQNEYYTNHYFSTMFPNAVSETIAKWNKTEDEQTPWSLLSKLRNDFATFSPKYEDIKRVNGQYLSDITELAVGYLNALGYTDIVPEDIPYKDDKLKEEIQIPVFTQVKKADGAPLLWGILACPVGDNPSLLKSKTFNGKKYKNEVAPDFSRNDVLGIDDDDLTIENLVTKILFNLDESPRFVLVVSINQIILIDRNKWNEKRHLEFDMDEIYSRHNITTFQALSTLLHKDCLCPESGSALLDNFDEESQKNASGVSQDLKYALRESIEILGNAVLDDMKGRQGIDLEQNPVDAGELTLECLRYMYRMLFVLFIEARPELGFAPVKNDSYLKGYSLESLRDCVDTLHIGTAEVDEGYYLYETLTKLYHLIYNGYPSTDETFRDLSSKTTINDCFIIPPLKAHIFDPEFTPLLERAKVKNKDMLRIIKLMSVSQGRNGGRKGRISYANLGINQMGAVYEALLSYRGFIAENDLYEVKKAGDQFNELDVGYFVSEGDLEQYTEDERVRYEHDDDDGHKKGKLRKYEKGKFIYRLAGREREKSASYYTPECLTKCLVKYALKELLVDKTADDILKLTICEPAMGSAAFLNEAINQLAEAYLDKKQKELNDSIPFEDRFNELQKVKMYIADRNVYGVDLNPVAVELGEVSLWLNTIYKGGYVPWFGTQLINGNSLIGARRQTYNQNQLKNGKWWEQAPERLSFNEKCYTNDRNQRIYHFLTGDVGMAHYDDKVIKSLEPEKIKIMNEWNKRFNDKYSDDEIKTLKRLSGVVDDLWARQIELRKRLEMETRDVLSVYGHEDGAIDSKTTIRQKDVILNQLYKTKDAKNAGPYARLKFAMDYWSALWFWPIEQAELLPDRATFLFELSVILGGTVASVVVDNLSTRKGHETQMELFPTEKQKALDDFTKSIKELDEVDIPSLCQKFPRLALVKQIAEQNHFMHWELEFADLFAERGGFDLMIGNPPWVKVQWDESAMLSEYIPQIMIKQYSANEVAEKRDSIIENSKIKNEYFCEYEGTNGTKTFLNACSNYSALKGVQTNLYKCFIPLSSEKCNTKGISAFVHPDGVFDDPKGGALRRMIYSRLRYHFQFANELRLFAEVHHHTTFSLNVYGGPQSINFKCIQNLYTPTTIKDCFNISNGELPGVKDKNNNWNTKGHKDRIIDVDKNILQLYAKLYDENGTSYDEARLPSIHISQLLSTLLKLMNFKIHIKDFVKDYFETHCWDETNDIKKTHTIKRNTQFTSAHQMVLNGPHFFVGNPIYQTPKQICKLNSDYDNIDLTNIPEDYHQRTNYVPDCEMNEFCNRMPIPSWDKKINKNFSKYYRFFYRGMIGCASEKTLIGAIMPCGYTHINAVHSITARGCGASTSTPVSPVDVIPTSTRDDSNIYSTKRCSRLLDLAGISFSIVGDFFVKTTNKSGLYWSTLSQLPYIVDERLRARVLLLTCLTTDYVDLWNMAYNPEWKKDSWGKFDNRLDNKSFTNLSEKWSKDFAFRSDYARRQALLEIDVLVAQNLGITLEELCAIYNIQCSVFKSYEDDTWYDANGRIVFSSKNYGDLTYKRPEFEKIKDAKAGEVFTRTITDDTMPGGPIERTITYVAPFDKCDRIADYETAWKFFEEKYGKDK